MPRTRRLEPPTMDQLLKMFGMRAGLILTDHERRVYLRYIADVDAGGRQELHTPELLAIGEKLEADPIMRDLTATITKRLRRA